jgi:hypothetical protein
MLAVKSYQKLHTFKAVTKEVRHNHLLLQKYILGHSSNFDDEKNYQYTADSGKLTRVAGTPAFFLIVTIEHEPNLYFLATRGFCYASLRIAGLLWLLDGLYGLSCNI